MVHGPKTPELPHRRLRIALIVLAGLLAVGGAAGVYLSIFGIWKEDTHPIERTAPPTPADVASLERKTRESPVAAIAPAPLPTAMPLVGAPGTRPDGYPAQWVDKPGLRSLLFHRKLDELTRYVEELQTAFEADPKKEHWMLDVADAFDTADRSIAPSLDAWVAAKPESFAPFLARGAYRVAVGYTQRGTKAAAKTHEDDFAGMRQAHEAARADLEKALTLRPKVVAAGRALQMIENGAGGGKAELAARERSFALCPSCMQIRVAAMWHATPRWGGSKEEMAAIAAAAPVALNARLAMLPAIIDLDEARTVRKEKPDEARAAVERACARGAYWESLTERAKDRWRAKDLDAALRDVEAALADRPGSVSSLEVRLGVLLAKKEWRRAHDDLVALLRVDSTSDEARRLKPTVVSGLRAEAERLLKAGDRGVALDTFDLATNLDPFDGKLSARRAAAIASGEATPELLAEAEKAVAAAPGDFRAVQRLDYLVSKSKNWKKIVDMWNAYLALHPDDGRAYLERFGTYTNLREVDLAEKDARRACELGVSEGCARSTGIRALAAPRASASASAPSP